ncbi:hypothetical protein BD324DRAFT_615730 [Kockovaella imperatae]|uniref:Uncharacterized protein n=1 Tax=Kockovaella imperatae TaxID=4999 RepID=A0A1Y1UPS8_9TREE|nr:hypothetical protein BD324DRAFT_615730 [Kockovaella imperatae]ORX39972.1 hypothetical protein BD324DRAFT_615730 [Kockovaella imperatae]
MHTRLFLLFTLLAPLLTAARPDDVYLQRMIVKRQDATDDGGASPSASPTPDATDTEDQPTDTVAASTTEAPAASTTDPAAPSASASTIGQPLGGAGQGESIPATCASCSSSYDNVIACLTNGNSDSCSPVCGNYTSTVNCISCLVSNGQPDVDQSAAQQVVWNLEASCQALGVTVQSITITAYPTTTGSFFTPSGQATVPTNTKSTKSVSHSGITVYNTYRTKALGSISTSYAVNPTIVLSTSGLGSRQAQLPVSALQLLTMGLTTILGLGIGHYVALF